jgi:hypothetical protein
MNKKKLFISILSLVILNCQVGQLFALDNTGMNPILLNTKGDEKLSKPNTSLSDHIRQYNYQYLDTFISVLAVLSRSKVAIDSYNTSKGEIKAKLGNGKEVYILVVSPQIDLTQVRITPSDGVYNIPLDMLNRVFENIKVELTKY